MKLRNKKTGEINLGDLHLDDFNSLAELNAEWEDYETKEYWVIDWGCRDRLNTFTENNDDIDTFNKSIGNYFETREEAEKAIEKLKAWKRLKDEGFKLIEKKIIGEYVNITFIFDYPVTKDNKKDLDLLFGGEE